MKLFVNGIEKGSFIFEGQKMCDFMGFVGKMFIASFEVISEVKVDGKVISWTEDERQISSCSSIEVNTQGTRELLVSALIEANRLCPSFQKRISSIADGIGTSHHQESLQDLSFSMDTLEWLYAVLSGVQNLLGISCDDVQSGEIFAAHLSRLQTILRDITGALQQEDFVILSDNLRYELIPCIEELQKFIPLLIKESDRKLLTLS